MATETRTDYTAPPQDLFPDKEEPPRKRTSSAKPKPPITAKGKVSLKEPIGGMLVLLNLPVQMFAPRDALDPAEVDALAMAIDEQAKLSPQFRKYVEAMIGAAGGGQLLVVCVMVGARRFARHGVFGPDGVMVDERFGQQLADMTGEKYNVPDYPVRNPSPNPEGTEDVAGGIPPVGGPSSY